MLLVSIILKTWNALEWTKLCVNSIKRYTPNTLYELIVVDNGSTDGTVEFLKQLSSAKLILNTDNKGCISANLQGLSNATGNYICLIDNDVVASVNWLERLVEAIQEDNQTGIAAPLQFSKDLAHPYVLNKSSRAVWDELVASGKYRYPSEILRAFCNLKDYDQFVQDFLLQNGSSSSVLDCPPDFVGGSCMLIARNALDHAGGLSDFGGVLYGGDDVDLCWRVQKAGYKVLRCGTAYVHHFKHTSMETNHLDRASHNRRSYEILFGRWEAQLEEILTRKLLQGSTLSVIRGGSPAMEWFVDWLLPEKLEQIVTDAFRQAAQRTGHVV